MASQARVEEYTYLRNDDKAYPKDIINNTKIGPVLEVLVTKHVDRYGIVMKIYSMVNDGTQSWVVISRAWKSTSQSVLWTTRSQCMVTKRPEARGDYQHLPRCTLPYRPATLEGYSCRSNSRKQLLLVLEDSDKNFTSLSGTKGSG